MFFIPQIKRILNSFAKEFNIFICPACMAKTALSSKNLCEDCQKRLNFIGNVCCPGCGGELDGVLAICSKCIKEKPRPFLLAISVINYTNYGKELIHLYKNGSSPELAKYFSNIALQKLVNYDLDFDIIIPVPLHWTKLLFRPFNQSELIAYLMAKSLHKPLVKALSRVKIGRSQKKLNSKERHKNLKNAFKAKKNLVKNKKILLVDDVFTTGATVSAATNALKKAGATVVYCITISRA